MLNISKLKLNSIKNNLLSNKGELTSNIRHNPSSTKEWFNSIYSYYKKDEKKMFNLDTMVYELIKSYFNMYNSRFERSIFLRKKTLRKRRYKLDGVLVSKPEFKHTNDKVKITLYVYNTELSFLKVKMNNLKKKIFAEYFYRVFTTKYITSSKLYLIKSLFKRVNILKSYILGLKKTRTRLIKRLNNKVYNNHLIGSNTINDYYKEWFSLKTLSNLMRSNGLFYIGTTLSRFEKNGRKIISRRYKNKKKVTNLLKKYSQVKILSKSIKIVRFLSVLFSKINNRAHITTINFYNDHIKNMPIFSISRKIYINSLKKMIFRLRLLLRYNRIISFNKFKFNAFLSPLKFYLEKIYKKDVEFDIVTVKDYRLNSSLFTQVIAKKLKNRKNQLDKLISLILNSIKLPISKRHEYLKGISKNRLMQNILLKQNINKNFVLRKPLIKLNILNRQLENKKLQIESDKLFYITKKGDRLDSLLRSIYPSQNIISNNTLGIYNNSSTKDLSNSLLIERNLENVVLDTIKNKAISGIKLHVAGRLSKKVAAGRSSKNIIHKGTMKDINSSYKQLSSILLKGNLQSNTQFTKINDNTRIGSFGLKGWISSI